VDLVLAVYVFKLCTFAKTDCVSPGSYFLHVIKIVSIYSDVNELVAELCVQCVAVFTLGVTGVRLPSPMLQHRA
jgi:hypothetical protein